MGKKFTKGIIMSLNQKVPWDDNYKVGIRAVDEQHQKLFDIVNRLYDLEDGEEIKEKLRIILYEFNDYMKEHFQDEEDYMLSIGYPYLEEHRKLHEEIVESLGQIIHTPAKLAIVKSKMRVVAKRVLIEHILNEDMKIKLYLLEKARKEEDVYNLDD